MKISLVWVEMIHRQNLIENNGNRRIFLNNVDLNKRISLGDENVFVLIQG